MALGAPFVVLCGSSGQCGKLGQSLACDLAESTQVILHVAGTLTDAMRQKIAIPVSKRSVAVRAGAESPNSELFRLLQRFGDTTTQDATALSHRQSATLIEATDFW